MGYKILDVKADIHEDVDKYCMGKLKREFPTDYQEMGIFLEDILDIVDKHFEKIER